MVPVVQSGTQPEKLELVTQLIAKPQKPSQVRIAPFIVEIFIFVSV